MAGELKITLVRSRIGTLPKQRKTIQALGFKKTNSSVIKKDNAAIRGMIRQINHLVTVEEL